MMWKGRRSRKLVRTRTLDSKRRRMTPTSSISLSALGRPAVKLSTCLFSKGQRRRLMSLSRRL